jgi:hypothetical protein
MPAEENEAVTNEVEKNATPATTSAEEEEKEANYEGNSADKTVVVSSSKPKASSGKLLRGLGSSLSRAISKATTGATASAESRPAPKLEDDPFPKGEPADEKPKE